MSSKLQVFNMVLNQVGVSDTVTTVDDTSALGVQLRNNYDSIYRMILESHDWDFATSYATLVLVSSAANSSPYANKFAFPNDFLKIQQLRNSDDEVVTQFAKAKDGLYTDEPVLKLRYTVSPDYSDVGAAPSSFIQALVLHMAKVLTPVITGSTDRQDFLTKEANKNLASASSQNISTVNQTYEMSSDIVDGRPW
jgi:hypothetical protein